MPSAPPTGAWTRQPASTRRPAAVLQEPDELNVLEMRDQTMEETDWRGRSRAPPGPLGLSNIACAGSGRFCMVCTRLPIRLRSMGVISLLVLGLLSQPLSGRQRPPPGDGSYLHDQYDCRESLPLGRLRKGRLLSLLELRVFYPHLLLHALGAQGRLVAVSRSEQRVCLSRLKNLFRPLGIL